MSEVIKRDKKIFIVPFIIAILLAISGVVMLINGINKYADAKDQYDIELAQYEEDKDKWWNNPREYDMPEYPGFGPNFPFVGIAGIVLIVMSIPCLIISFTPTIKKKAKEYQKAALDSYSSQSNNIFDMLTGDKTTHTCAYCGATIPKDKTKCDSCGASVKK